MWVILGLCRRCKRVIPLGIVEDTQSLFVLFVLFYGDVKLAQECKSTVLCRNSIH